MKLETSIGYTLLIAGFLMIARKTYLISVLAPQQSERTLLDTAILMVGGIFMGVGVIIRNLSKKVAAAQVAS